VVSYIGDCENCLMLQRLLIIFILGHSARVTPDDLQQSRMYMLNISGRPEPPMVVQISWYCYISDLLETRVTKAFRIFKALTVSNKLQSIAPENPCHISSMIVIYPAHHKAIILRYKHSLLDIKFVCHILSSSFNIPDSTKDYVAEDYLTYNWCSGTL